MTDRFKRSLLVSSVVLSLALMPSIGANASHVHHHFSNHDMNAQIDRVIKLHVHRHRSHHVRRAHIKGVSMTNSPKHHHRRGYKRILHIAKSKLHDRYASGGNGPDTFDCSGFTKYIYAHGAHKILPRTAEEQYRNYPHVHHAKKGDLVFFGANSNSITHVGMKIGHNRMIDAQDSGVKIEPYRHVSWWHYVGASHP